MNLFSPVHTLYLNNFEDKYFHSSMWEIFDGFNPLQDDLEVAKEKEGITILSPLSKDFVWSYWKYYSGSW